MTIQIDNETDISLGFDMDALIKKVIEGALDFEQCPYDPEVNVVLTDNAGIHQVNLEYRQMDRPTDVLSFPMAEYETPGDFDGLESQDDVFHPETGEYMMGDIMISLEKVMEQAESFGHSTQRELAFLVAHSMLHLMGYDHMEDEERKVMEEKQREILESLGISR